MLQIRLLGGFQLALDDQPLPPLPSHTARALVAFLVCHAEQTHSRSRLAGLFYPDLPEAKARRRLSHALWQIRSALGKAGLATVPIVADGEMVRWHQTIEYTVDIGRFEQAIELAEQSNGILQIRMEQLAAAVDLYRGDLLDGLYDEWILPLRARVEARYEAVLTELAQLYKSQGQYEQSLVCTQRLLLLDPLHEQRHAEIMRLCHLLGRTNEALQQYDELRQRLDDEFAAEPTPQTRSLYQQILRQSTTAEPTAPPTTVALANTESSISLLVGRSQEREQIIGALEESLRGVGTMVLLEGEPGIGKSRLLQEVADDGEWRGLRVLWGRGHESAEHSPYALLRSLLAQELTPLRLAQLVEMVDAVWLTELTALLPTIEAHLPTLPPRAQLQEGEERDRLWAAIEITLQALGQLAPYLILIDDAQWIDSDSLALLQQLQPLFAQGPFCLCLAFRSEEARARDALWRLVRTVDRSARSQRIHLQPLAVSAVEEIVRQRIGPGVGLTHLVERLAQAGGGNPLFVQETLRALQESGHLRQNEQRQWTLDPAQTVDMAIQPTQRLQQVVISRLAHLDEPWRQTLETAAVLGTECPLSLLQTVGTRSNLQTATAVEALVQRNFLVMRQGHFAVAHDQIRQIVYTQIDDNGRRQLHRRIAQTLHAMGTEDSATLAHHFACGHCWAEAVDHYRRAGTEATALAAYEAAAQFYSRALDALVATSLPAATHFDLLAEYEEALATLGKTAERWQTLDQMSTLATTPLQQSRVLRRRFWAQLDTEDLEDAESSARSALGLAEESGDLAATAASHLAVGTALDRRTQSDEAVTYLQQAVTLYQTLEQPEQEAQARVELANALTATANYNLALPELQRAYELYQSTNRLAGQAHALSRLGALQLERGESDAAERCFAEALTITQTIGYRRVEATTLVNWANLHFFRNRIADFLACNERALALLQALGLAHGEAFVQVNVASILQALIGDYDQAKALVEKALPHFRTIGDRSGEAQCLEQLGNIAMAQGDYAKAHTHLAEALVAVQAAGDHWMEVFVHAAQALLAQKEQHAADGLAALANAETICDEYGLADQRTFLQSMRAQLLAQQGELTTAADIARATFAALKPGVQQGHKVAYYCFETLTAAGLAEESAAALAYAHDELEALLSQFTAAQRESSLHHVPEHRAILRHWQATHATVQEVSLIRADIPTGRPVTDDERRVVTLTVHHPDDDQIQGKPARRQAQLRRLLQEAATQGVAPTVEDLATLLKAGKATIKRDLAALRAAGVAIRTRGSR